MKKQTVIFVCIFVLVIAAALIANYFSYGSIIARSLPKPPATNTLEHYDIVSLEKSNGISGGFVFGIGMVGTKIYYVVYEKKAEDRYKLLKIDAEITEIVETDSKPPSYEVTTKPSGVIEKRVLTIPKNTIRKEFKL